MKLLKSREIPRVSQPKQTAGGAAWGLEYLTKNTFSERGCPAATLRIWPFMQGVHKAPIELCGDTLEHNVEIVSQSNIMKLS